MCELAQVYPRADGVKTLCLACGFPFGDAPQACTCTSALRSEAVAVLHAELVAGHDPEPALEIWRAQRLPLATVASQTDRARSEA